MLWAAVAYASGIIAGVYLWRPTLWWVVAVLFFAGAASYFAGRRSRLGWVVAMGAFFLFGALHIQLRGAAPRLDTSIRPYANTGPIEITAHVTGDGRVQQAGPKEIRQTVDVEVDEIRTAVNEILPVAFQNSHQPLQSTSKQRPCR